MPGSRFEEERTPGKNLCGVRIQCRLAQEMGSLLE
jgi:hypothetical protein